MRLPDYRRPHKPYQPEAIDFRLRKGAAAVDAGLILPNINDGYTGRAPDLGAIERGEDAVIYGPRGPGAE